MNSASPGKINRKRESPEKEIRKKRVDFDD